jgi:hypothetical protein
MGDSKGRLCVIDVSDRITARFHRLEIDTDDRLQAPTHALSRSSL